MIEYSLDALAERGICDVVLVVAPGKEGVAKYVALSRPDLNLMTVYQRRPLGTGHAVGLLKPFFGNYYGRFLYLMPDSVHAGLPIMLPEERYQTVFLWPTDRPERLGVFSWDVRGFVDRHVEKRRPSWPPPYWAWGAAILHNSFVEFCAKAVPEPAKEFTIDDAFDLWLKGSNWIKAVPCDGYYVDCGSAEGIAEAERRLGGARGGP